MAVVSTPQTLVDGARNLVVKCFITGDASDIVALKLIDASIYSSPVPGVGASLKVMRVVSSLENFGARLLWDATTDVEFLHLPAGDADQKFYSAGGLINNAGTGITGDIMISTIGIAAAEDGTVTLWMKKRDI